MVGRGEQCVDHAGEGCRIVGRGDHRAAIRPGGDRAGGGGDDWNAMPQGLGNRHSVAFVVGRRDVQRATGPKFFEFGIADPADQFDLAGEPGGSDVATQAGRIVRVAVKIADDAPAPAAGAQPGRNRDQIVLPLARDDCSQRQDFAPFRHRPPRARDAIVAGQGDDQASRRHAVVGMDVGGGCLGRDDQGVANVEATPFGLVVD
jgi:hypothetical protein